MENLQNDHPEAFALLAQQRVAVLALLGAIRSEEKRAFRDLDRIDAALRLFGSGRPIRYATGNRPPNGEITRAILRMLRTSNQSMTSAEITDAMRRQNPDTSNVSIVRARKRMAARLSKMSARGLVQSRARRGPAKLWELNR